MGNMVLSKRYTLCTCHMISHVPVTQERPPLEYLVHFTKVHAFWVRTDPCNASRLPAHNADVYLGPKETLSPTLGPS